MFFFDAIYFTDEIDALNYKLISIVFNQDFILYLISTVVNGLEMMSCLISLLFDKA